MLNIYLYHNIWPNFRSKILTVTDQRVKIMSEVIKSMRIVKMYCWESAFERMIRHIRKYILIHNLFSNQIQLCDCSF